MSHQSPHYRLKQHDSSPTCLWSTRAAPGGVYVCDCCVVVYAGCIMPKIKSTSFVPLANHRRAKWRIMRLSLFHPRFSQRPYWFYLLTSLSQKRMRPYRITETRARAHARVMHNALCCSRFNVPPPPPHAQSVPGYQT